MVTSSSVLLSEGSPNLVFFFYCIIHIVVWEILFDCACQEAYLCVEEYGISNHWDNCCLLLEHSQDTHLECERLTTKVLVSQC